MKAGKWHFLRMASPPPARLHGAYMNGYSVSTRPPTRCSYGSAFPEKTYIAPTRSRKRTKGLRRIERKPLICLVAGNADQTHQVQIRSSKAAYIIKLDHLDLEIVSSRAGYLTLLSVGSSGKIFQLFPNDLDRNNHMDANVPLRLPRPEWRVPSGGPAGTNRFLAVVSGVPDRFANLGIPVGGRFKAFEATANNAKDIVERLISPTPGCNSLTPTRDFDSPEANPCGSSYGAGAIDVLEVN